MKTAPRRSIPAQALVRSVLDATHKLRGVQVDDIGTQLKEGRVEEEEVKGRDPDLVLQEGWEGSFEFVRDPWVKGSFATAFPEALPGPTLE